MANTPQAKKRIRRNNARAEVNGARVSRIRTFIKKVETALTSGDKGAAAAALAASSPEEQKRLTTEPEMRSSKPARSSEDRAMSAP